ncbi:MAG: M23 family metallopeptidase [Firmicutes bacterium]|nr:M23 family metallopeptidase [Bacillota bacterium]
MSYGTFRVRRTFPRRYYNRVAASVSRSVATPVVRKVAICLLVFLFVWMVARIPVTPARRLTSVLRWAFTSDSDFTAVFSFIRRLAEGLPETGFWAFPVTGSAGAKMAWPVDGRLTALYGWKTDPNTKQEKLYEGIDISAPAGTPVKAALAGVVVSVRDSATYGKVIEVEHGRGLKTVYYRCAEVAVIPHTRVERGDVIARVGALPGAGSPYIHFQVVVEGNRVDPLKHLPAL